MDRSEKKVNTKLEKLQAMLSFDWIIRKTLKLWWVYLLTGLIAGFAGYLFAKMQKPRYRSHLTFALDDSKGGASNIISLASEFGFNLGQSSSVFSGDNILNILKSRHIVESVLLDTIAMEGKKWSIIEYYLYISGYYKNGGKGGSNVLHFPAGLPRDKFSYQQDSLLRLVYGQFAKSLIKAERPDKRLSIYEINVTTPGEQLTKIFTDRLVAEANNFYTKIKSGKAKQTLDILEERAAMMKGNLNSSISEKAAVQDVNLNPAFSQAQVPVMKQQANIQVYSAAYAELFKNLELARFQYLNDIPLMQIIDGADFPMEKIQAGKLITAIFFSVAACGLLFVIIWLRRIFLITSHQNMVES